MACNTFAVLHPFDQSIVFGYLSAWLIVGLVVELVRIFVQIVQLTKVLCVSEKKKILGEKVGKRNGSFRRSRLVVIHLFQETYVSCHKSSSNHRLG